MSLLGFYPQIGTVLSANDFALTYLGWRIFGYRFLHDEPELQVPVSKEDLLSALRERFTEPDWSVSEENGKLMLEHAETQFEVKVEVHGWDIEVAYDDGLKRETYLCELSSEGFAWKRMEHAIGNCLERSSGNCLGMKRWVDGSTTVASYWRRQRMSKEDSRPSKSNQNVGSSAPYLTNANGEGDGC